MKGFQLVQEELYEGLFNHTLTRIKEGDFHQMSVMIKKVIQKANQLGHLEGKLIADWFDKIVSG